MARRGRLVAVRARTIGALATVTALATGCGGGLPLLYPARTLKTGEVRAMGGTSGNLLVGSLATDVAAAHAEAGRSPGAGGPLGGVPTDATYAKGALALAAVAPGIAPYVAARVGLGARFEGGAVYTGRSAHLDVRRSFDWNAISLSIGVGLETPVYGNSESATLPQVDLAAIHGYGADLPVLVGWRSVAGAYMVWGGLRAGWDHVDVGSVSTAPAAGEPVTLSADRVYGGAVVGLAGGFRHIHVALELDVAYQSVQGKLDEATLTVAGVSLAPAGAVWWTF